jgi:predicted  nucleic acid-binding Zn-ribbon protein
VFSQIASALKDKLGELSNQDNVSRAETLRGVRGLALAAFSFMADMSTARDINETIARDKTAVRDQAKTEKEAAMTQREPLSRRKTDLEGAIKGADDSVRASQQVISDLTPEFNRLFNERASLKLPEQQKRFDELFAPIYGQPNGLYTRIAAANNNITTQNANKTAWGNELRNVNDALAPLDSKITSLDKTEKDAEQSRSTAQNTVSTLSRAMETFFENVSSLLLGANNVTQGNAAREAGTLAPEGDSFDQLIADLAKALVALGEAMANTVRSAEIVGTPDGAGLSGTDSVPDRFGQLSAPVARAVAFAGLVGATMSALTEVLRSLSSGLGMQTAGEFAANGQPRVKVGL